MKKLRWILFAMLAIIIGLYPFIYFVIDRKFGLLSSKSDTLLADMAWNIGFYLHIVLGGIALLTGWIQFNKQFRQRRLSLHRLLGKIYVLSVLISALAGFYIAFYATGGVISKVGFGSLAIIWFSTTLVAFLAIRQGNLQRHQIMMIYSYAACFAAVTLRIWLPILVPLLGNFTPAYQLVSWLCWVPNLLVASWLVKKIQLKQIAN